MYHYRVTQTPPALSLTWEPATSTTRSFGYPAPSFTMATGGGKIFNPAYTTFRKHSADLLTVIQDPEVLAWELFSESVISSTVVVFANNMTHERGARTSKLLMAVGSQIEVDPDAFNVFLSVLAKRPSMSDLYRRMKDAYSKSVGQARRSFCIFVVSSDSILTSEHVASFQGYA